MLMLIFCVILIAAHAGPQGLTMGKIIDCSYVQCATLWLPSCPEGSVPVKDPNPVDCCKPYKCRPVCYTQWFDRDDPSKLGDYETLKELRNENPGKICPKPLNIQATTLSGVSAESTGQVFQVYDTVSGFVCVNSQQNTECLNYKVRFGCPCS